MSRLSLPSLLVLLPACGSSKAAAPASHPDDASFPPHHDAGDTDAAPDVYVLPPAWSGGAPVDVTSTEDAIDLAIDGSNVYWQGAGGSVYACPLSGSCSSGGTLLSTLIGSNGITFGSLAAAGGTAYFVSDNGDTLSSAAFSNPNKPATAYTAPSGGGDGPIVTDGTNLYFMERTTADAGPSTLYLRKCAVGGSCTSPTLLYSETTENGGGLGPLFVAGGELFFVDDTDEGSSGGALRVVSTDGGSPRTLCSSNLLESGAQAMVVAQGYAFFTTSQSTSNIYQCASSGSEDQPAIFVEDYAPYGLATDGTYVYWTNYAPVTGTIAVCPAGGTCVGAMTVADNQNSPYAIAANTKSVFWSTETKVYRADR